MSEAVYLAHHIHGRLRLKIRNRRVIAAVRDAIASVPGTCTAEVRERAASIVVLYAGREDSYLARIAELGRSTDLFEFGMPPPPSRGRVAIAYALVALGIAGVLLPIVPGTPFLIVGVVLLGGGGG